MQSEPMRESDRKAYEAAAAVTLIASDIAPWKFPYTVTARPDTGLWNAKVGIWLFLASEVMLFGGLFSAYVFLAA